MAKVILVVEDNATLREDIIDVLTYENYIASGASDGEQGYNMASQLKPDLIIADVSMQPVDGFKFYEKLSKNPQTATIPVIFLTALADRENMRYGMQLGADDYITKPFKNDELLTAIETCLNKRIRLEEIHQHVFARRLIQNQEQERQRLSLLLQEGVLQHLSAINMSLSAHLLRGDADATQQALAQTQEQLATLISDTESILMSLRPQILDYLGLEQALLWLFEQLPIYVKFEFDELAVQLPSEFKLMIFRIVEEALQNVAQHARVSEASVYLRVENEQILIDVIDKGQGFVLADIQNRTHIVGLLTMQERSLLIGAHLSIDSKPLAGTHVRLVIPIAIAGKYVQTTPTPPVALSSLNPSHNPPTTPTSKFKEQVALIVDHSELIQNALTSLLKNHLQFDRVLSCQSGGEALRTLGVEKVDLLLLDMSMSDISAIEILRTIRAQQTGIAVIAMSSSTEAIYAIEAMRHGADGYMLKQSRVEEFIEGIRAIGNGKQYISHQLADQLIEFYITPENDRHTLSEVYRKLTEREREILLLVARGLTNMEIAENLSISHRTVETHRRNIMQKLDLRNEADIVRYAVRNNLITI